MSAGSERPATAYVHGLNGPVVLVPGRVAAWLERYLELDTVRRRERGSDPEVDNCLIGLAVAAAAWRASVTGSRQAATPEAESPSSWLSTTETANKLHITDRAVRLAIAEHRIPAHKVQGTWRISREDLAHYTASRNQ